MGFLKKFIFNRIADIMQIGENTVIRLFIFVNVVFAYFKGIELAINDYIHKIIGAFAILH